METRLAHEFVVKSATVSETLLDDGGRDLAVDGGGHNAGQHDCFQQIHDLVPEVVVSVSETTTSRRMNIFRRRSWIVIEFCRHRDFFVKTRPLDRWMGPTHHEDRAVAVPCRQRDVGPVDSGKTASGPIARSWCHQPVGRSWRAPRHLGTTTPRRLVSSMPGLPGTCGPRRHDPRKPVHGIVREGV